MTQKIIALVDGSLYARSVCDHAAWIAGRTGASIELLHVLGRREAPDQADLSGSLQLGARTALLEELAALDEQRAKLVVRRGRAILEDAQAILEEAGISQNTARLRHGDLITTVAEQEKDAAMIVIGKRGEAADFARGHLGSNLERIIRVSHKPVFVASRSFKPISKLLVAYDGGTSAMRAVDHIAHSTLYAGLQVHVVTAGVETPDIRKGLENALSILTAAGIDGHIRVVPGQPDKVLSQIVEDDHFDLLLMGAYGHSRIRSLIIGSTTTEMIRSCKIPVVLMR
ncbi:MAG: universal stress protein [Beijerinckiaceae bacterium]|nr:universal stress protein [Beijerinckiaceae bacterium]